MIETCFQECLTASLPLALDTGFERIDDDEGSRYPLSHVHTEDVVAAFVRYCQIPPTILEATGRLETVGKFLVDTTSLGSEAVEEAVRVSLWRDLAAEWNTFEGLTKFSLRTPKFLRNLLQKSLEAKQKASLSSDFIVPVEFKLRGNRGDSLRALTEYLYNVGSLLRWWPYIFRIARSLSSDNLGQRV